MVNDRLQMLYWHMKKFIENSVDSVKFLAYNDIETERLSVDESKGMKPENAGI